MVSHRPRLAAGTLVAASLLIATACSGDDDAASTTTVQVTTTVAPTTSAPPTTAPETTSVPTTVAAPTTAEPTTVPSTSPPESTSPETTTTTLPEGVPPRVTFPDDDDKQAVVDAFYAYSDAMRAASADPSDTALREGVRATVGNPFAERVETFLDELIANGEAIVSVPITHTDIYPPSLIVVDDIAAFDACAIDGDIRVEVGAGDDGEDLVVDDSVNAADLSYSLALVDGAWVVNGLQRFGFWEGQEQCGDL